MRKLTLPILFAIFSVFIITGCPGPFNGESFGLHEMTSGLPAGDIYQSNVSHIDGWEVVQNGLPHGDFTAGGMTVFNNTLFITVDDSSNAYDPGEGDGVYYLDNGSWEKAADKPVQYGIGGIVSAAIGSGSDQGLFAISHGNIFRLIPEGSGYRWANNGEAVAQLRENENDATPAMPHTVRQVAPIPSAFGGGIAVLAGTRQAPEFWRFTPSSSADGMGSWSSLGTLSPGDDKPHVTLAVNPGDGSLWYKTNYSGIYRSSISGDSWTQVSENSGSMGFLPDGTSFISYEIQPTTQIATIFQAQGSASSPTWQEVFSTRGYAAPLTAYNTELFASIGGRFGSLLIGSDRAYTLPNPMAGLRLTGDMSKGVRARNTTVLGTSIYTAQRVPRGGGVNALRILRHTPDTSTLPFYLNNVLLDSAALTSSSETEAVGMAMTAGGVVIGENLVSSGQGRLYPAATGTPGSPQELNSGEGLLHLEGDDDSLLVVATNTRVFTASPASPASPVGLLVEGESEKRRVSIGTDGTVAVMTRNNEVQVFFQDTVSSASSGQAAAPDLTITLDRSYSEDIAVDSAQGLVYVAGFDNKTLPSGNPVQVAYLTAYSLSDGSYQWKLFGFDGSDLSNNIADTRLYRVNLGRDGNIHILGESAGTQSIFRYNGREFSGNQVLRSFDFYNDLWNTGSAHFTYHAVADPENRRVEHGQFTMTRLSDGGSNSFRIKDGDITADPEGRIFIGASAAAHIAHRNAQRISGQYIGTYAGGEPSLLGIAPEYRQRTMWTSFNRDSLNGTVRDVLTDPSGGFLYILSTVQPAEGSGTAQSFAAEGSGITLSGSRSYLVRIDISQFSN